MIRAMLGRKDNHQKAGKEAKVHEAFDADCLRKFPFTAQKESCVRFFLDLSIMKRPEQTDDQTNQERVRQYVLE